MPQDKVQERLCKSSERKNQEFCLTRKHFDGKNFTFEMKICGVSKEGVGDKCCVVQVCFSAFCFWILMPLSLACLLELDGRKPKSHFIGN